MDDESGPERPPLSALQEMVLNDRPLVIDGGLASELEHRGADLDDPLWSARVLIEEPALIRAVHLDYLRAGAGCLLTSTYQASFAGFQARGFRPAEARQLFAYAVLIAREALADFRAECGRIESPAVSIVGALGSFGACLANGSEFRGDYRLDAATARDFHGPRIEALAAASVEALAFETMPRLDEAIEMVRLLEELDGPPAWVSFSLKSFDRLACGDGLAEAAAVLSSSPKVLALGVNCCPPDFVDDAIIVLRSATSKKILVYPNSGEHWSGGRWLGESWADDFGRAAASWRALGASAVGGCCRTRPRDIAAMVASLRTEGITGTR